MSEWYETFKDLSAGTIGGCAGIVVGQPLDTIKVRLQSQGTSASGTSTMYKGPVDALVKMVCSYTLIVILCLPLFGMLGNSLSLIPFYPWMLYLYLSISSCIYPYPPSIYIYIYLYIG